MGALRLVALVVVLTVFTVVLMPLQSAAIRLKQLNADLSVVVVEKGSEVGAHILSGAVIDPIALDRLLPDWRGEDTPIKTAVADDRFYWLGQSAAPIA